LLIAVLIADCQFSSIVTGDQVIWPNDLRAAPLQSIIEPTEHSDHPNQQSNQQSAISNQQSAIS
jgi:hypothetical protein